MSTQLGTYCLNVCDIYVYNPMFWGYLCIYTKMSRNGHTAMSLKIRPNSHMPVKTLSSPSPFGHVWNRSAILNVQISCADITLLTCKIQKGSFNCTCSGFLDQLLALHKGWFIITLQSTHDFRGIVEDIILVLTPQFQAQTKETQG